MSAWCAVEAIPHAQCSIPSVGAMNSFVSLLVQSVLAAQCNISRAENWPPDYAGQALKYGLETYDFVVVGAGTAGSVISSRLSENPNWKVLVLEAGGDPPQESEVPRIFATLQHTKYSYPYYVEPDGRSCKAFKNNRCYWPRGRAIGGSGSINGMLYVRGNRFDFDRLYEEGNYGWDYNSVLPYFDKSTRSAGNDTHPKGYVAINDFEVLDDDIIDMIFKAANEMGVPTVAEYKEGSFIGYTNLQGFVENGRRSSSGKGHLARVSHRKNLHVIKNAEVTKVLFDASGQMVTSVEFMLEQETLNVFVKNEVIVSAGTIDTPKLLMLSGVGPTTLLQTLNIPVIHNLSIGENLQDHLDILVFVKLSGQPFEKKHNLDSIYKYLLHQQGPLSTHGNSLTGFINTRLYKNALYPDIEFHHLIIRRGDFQSLESMLGSFNVKEALRPSFRKALTHHDILLIHTILSHPKSVGNIKLKSPFPKDPPIINANYMYVAEDVEVLMRAITYLMALESTQAFQQKQAELLHIPIKECDQYIFKSEKYWRCYITYFSTTIYHHVGTAKMGPPNDEKACVNSRLLLNGVSNLRVVDGSIMPYVTSGNTNAPILMIAEKAADFIKQDYGYSE